ncbi:ferritin-like domain-containing protein [Pelagibius marinus]|uniref:ferritin-like domain-containing protein n=1 Tax=Pelagibius marinus TaxID=2762760 RepID=UPI001872ADCF|nr:ferritin-like domain-containing protein [Pelagibius marinus]
MTGGHWTLDDIPWDKFDPGKADPELVKIVKAASMVEYNGADYATYLCNVFPDDAEFQAAADAWALEEIQHGEALARWAKLADDSFNFDESFGRFRDGYKIAVDSESSIRGSRSGELVARCIVEVGTSSYYASIGATTQEPVLREVCRRIAADELRHYRLFYTFLRRYLERENIGKWKRLAVALGRIGESEDDELAYAFYAANENPATPYDRKTYGRAYMKRAMACYREPQVRRAVAMIFKAAGLNPQGRTADLAARAAFGFIRWRGRKLAAA